MIQVPLINLPNQSLSIQLDGNQYDISVHATQDNSDGTSGIMAVDIVRDNTTVILGVRAVYGYPLIPYKYLASTFGNFLFITQNDDYPDWRQFGITQYLLYATNEEIEAIINGTNSA